MGRHPTLGVVAVAAAAFLLAVPHQAVADASPRPWVAFQTSLRDGEFGPEGIFLVRPDGTAQHEVGTAVPGEHVHPDWSSDGTTLVFAADIGERRQLATMDPVADPTGSRARVFDACSGDCVGDDDPALSPDGTRVAYVEVSGPFVSVGDVEVPSSFDLRVARLTCFGLVDAVTLRHTETVTALDAPRWSPDGSRLVFWSDHTDATTGAVDGTAVFTIRADGTRLTRVTPWSMFAGDADWSPDGRRLVFATHPLVVFNFDAVISNLFTSRPDGSQLRQVTTSTTSDDRATQARWTPDGRIVFTRVTPAGRTLWTVTAAGTSGRAVPQAGQAIRTHGDVQPLR